MGSGANANGAWFVDYSGLDDEVHAADFIWQAHIDDDSARSSVLDMNLSSREDDDHNQGSRKRNRPVSTAKPGSKACREKMRRDKLTERFTDLLSLLEPGKSLKDVDKIAILGDAARRLSQLRFEAEKFKESNESLQSSIKSLKMEKMELKEEKMKLKAEKERVEQMMKNCDSVVAPPPVPFSPAAYKNMSFASYFPSPMAMWQWLPQTAVDTSQDHVLRPPVA
ncbi:transcription factor ILR3-like [Wolffia australiana]